jgi:hypothetical protein
MPVQLVGSCEPALSYYFSNSETEIPFVRTAAGRAKTPPHTDTTAFCNKQSHNNHKKKIGILLLGTNQHFFRIQYHVAPRLVT